MVFQDWWTWHQGKHNGVTPYDNPIKQANPSKSTSKFIIISMGTRFWNSNLQIHPTHWYYMILQSRSSYESLNQIINYYQLSPAIINLHLYNRYLGSIYFNTFSIFQHSPPWIHQIDGVLRLPKASQAFLATPRLRRLLLRLLRHRGGHRGTRQGAAEVGRSRSVGAGGSGSTKAPSAVHLLLYLVQNIQKDTGHIQYIYKSINKNTIFDMFKDWWVFITFHEFCIFVWVSGLRMLIADLVYLLGAGGCYIMALHVFPSGWCIIFLAIV